ncbi:hypothetical protein F511_07207 [Dorcoceras hygrometricum]|uniref:Uncharacterized protein n=1 Tax=Dorcoceras hygrometricum TaxID=472368 RepID=A0A2Z7D1P6_9LAMI|nr:hypothetical protein F511_07207 [Dorcoceras hygrometricum]
MEYSLISSSLHVSFDSVLAMDDIGIVAMYGALVASGLKGFLGCPAIFYEDSLTKFFQNGSVRDGMVVSTIQGTILTKKTVHRYVVINEKVTVVEVANKPRVKRTPVKKAVSRKRPATAEVEPVVSKKKRTKVGKADKGSVLITVAQEAIPLTIFEPTPAAPAEQPPVPKRKSKNRRLRLHKDSDDEIVKEQGVVEDAVENIFEEQREATSAALVVEETIVGGLTEKASEPTVENEPVVKSTAEEVRTTSADDVDLIIEQVIAETAQNETDEEEQNVDGIDVEGTTVSGTDVGEQTIPRDEETNQWLNLPYAEFIAQEADRPVVTARDTDEEMETVDFGTVDWAVKMRIRPPELETSICDAKYHVSLSTISVLGKCVYLVTLVMSLFDLQDVCIAIGSIATLDLPMVVDLIVIYGLKGPYCMLTTTKWFLQALSVIPMGSWGDVARRFYHDPLGRSGIVIPEPQWLWAHG